jgi:hypothetical protein
MRTYGRITNANGSKTWVVVQTDANGFNDAVYITTLCQCIKLNLGESPFFANFGIPQQQSVISQIFPDYYINQLQTYFAQFFVSLTIKKIPSSTPTYDITAVTHQGSIINASIPV